MNATQSAEKIYVGDSITFSINAFDPDGDELDYKWNFRMFDSEKDGASLRRTFTVPGVKYITAVISDGIEEIEHTFKAEVYEKIELKQQIVEEPEPVIVEKVIEKTQIVVSEPAKPQITVITI